MRRLEACSLALLGFLLWLFSPSALSSSHSPSPFKRWNAPTDGSVIMMCPFSMLESSTSRRATTCEDSYLHMWWEGRNEKDVGKRVMGSWYRRMDLCTYYLDTLYTYIYIQMYIHAKRVQQPQPGKRRHTNFVFQTTSLNFFFEILKIRYDSRNSLNWSDHLKPFEIYILGISSSKSRHSINEKCFIFVTCWH